MLSGKLAIVTGGTRGIGQAIALELQNKGAEVLITGTQSNFSPKNKFRYFGVDFSDRQATLEFAAMLREVEPDILINNAGINKIMAFDEIPLEDFDKVQQINQYAPFMLCQAVIPKMKEKAWGRIVNICSIWGKISKEYRASYSTSKFALDGMTSALSAEVSQYGILANCVSPGFIDTELTRSVLGENGINKLLSQVPVGRMGSVEEIAKFVVWLSSTENTYITGQNIAIDGGFTRV
ncbi:SDR family oxidoreductase [Candidatus Pseudothioglobus singularis]|nr:SDR family oxidoreductase [Candidatus Pseudothioglobus singularis]